MRLIFFKIQNSSDHRGVVGVADAKDMKNIRKDNQ